MSQFFTTPDFLKSLEKLEPGTGKQVRAKLDFLSQQSDPFIFAKKLTGYKNVYRFRTGDYRVIFKKTGANIILLLVKHRKDIYQKI